MSPVTENMLLIHLQFDADIGLRRQAAAQPGGQTVALAGIGVVSADGEGRCVSPEGRLPALAHIHLARPGRVVEQADIGIADLAVEFGCEAVAGDMEKPTVRCEGLPNQALCPCPVGRVMAPQNLMAHAVRCLPDHFEMEARMAYGSIQIHQKPAYGGNHQGRREGPSEGPSHRQGAGIIAAMGVQQRFVAVKKRPIGCRDTVSAVLAGDDQSIVGLAF